MTTLLEKQKEFRERTEGKVAVLTNGKQAFILRDYGKGAQNGVCYANNITVKEWVSPLKANAMHEWGHLHYVNGTGDSKVLNGDNVLRRGRKIGNFEIW